MFVEPAAPEVHGSYRINGSVFREAFLVGVDALVTIVMDITALRWALFEILGVPTVIDILL